MERVKIVNGEIPVVLVAPHNNDTNTGLIAEKISSEMGAFAVINQGWNRSDNFDYFASKADCNNIIHVHEDVIKEEFLDPILRMVSKIINKIDRKAYVFYLHGCGNSVRNKVKDPNLDIIIGYGEGSPSSYSCDIRIKDAFCYFLENESFGVYEGKKRGKYSGRSKNNMNQLFKLWYPQWPVDSMQIEIIKELRENEEMVQIASDGLIGAIDDLLLFDDTTSIIKRTPKFI